VNKDDPGNLDNDWNTGQIDMHGFPTYDKVLNVQNDLKEQELRENHPDLQKAYEDYQILLKKYGFWDKITK